MEFQSTTVQQEDNLAIFDFTDSSSTDASTLPRTCITELAKAARKARRHSAVPAPSCSIPSDDRKPEGAPSSLHKRTGSGNVKISITTNLGKSLDGSAAARLVSLKKKKRLPPSSSNIDLKAKADVSGEKARELSALRVLRAATRMRSTLLQGEGNGVGVGGVCSGY